MKITVSIGGVDYDYPARIEEPEPPSAEFPHEGCDCGIYASVNFDEIGSYLDEDDNDETPGEEKTKPVLCIIEPKEGADVILSRKGWRAGAAFISEIVGETIDIDAASQLLSIAWHRPIDIQRLYENR